MRSIDKAATKRCVPFSHSIPRKGFTSVELLTITIIAMLLVGILGVAVSSAVRHASAAKCLSNLHEISIEITNDETLTGRLGSRVPQLPAVGDPRVRCPAVSEDQLQCYGLNIAIRSRKDVPNASNTVLVYELRRRDGDADSSWALPPKTPTELEAWVDVTRHGRGANYLFVDGHAEEIKWQAIQRLYNEAHNFLDPHAQW